MTLVCVKMSLKLKVVALDGSLTKTIEFRNSDLVYDAVKKITAKIPGNLRLLLLQKLNLPQRRGIRDVRDVGL